MEFGGWQLVLAFASVALSIYYYFLKKLNYWKDKGVPSPTPRESLASSVDFLLMRTSIHERLINNYKKWRKYAFYGVSPESQPALVVNDLDLIRCVLIKDFQVFCGRGIHFDEKMDPLDAHLFNIDGSRWKALRTKLTPVFTSGKLKHMFDLLLECANHYEKYIHNQVKLGKDIEFREASAKFTTDVIGSCAFGLEMNALSQEDSEFRDAGRRIFEHGRWRAMKRILVALAPRLFRFLNVRINDKDISDFFIASVKETIAYRQRENIVRHDLIDTLIDIQKKHDNKEFELTIEVMAAQAFVFFLAGFETSSTTISFALYELAYSPDVQEKLINEIRDALKQNKGQLTYALVNEMKYLEMVIDETLRKDPPAPFLQRLAHQPWTIPNTNITIEPGTKVVIPAYCIHHDPEYYPEPELFDPERFSEENKHTRHPMAYLPFGDGPKNCIGARFAAYQVKLGLIKVLQNYRVKPTKLSPYPYKIDRTSVITKPEGGVHLKLEPLK